MVRILMITYKSLASKPAKFLRYTGLELEQFNFLLPKIEKEFSKTEEKRISRINKNRKRARGAKQAF